VKIKTLLIAYVLSFISTGVAFAANEQIISTHRAEFDTYVYPYELFGPSVIKKETGAFIDYSWETHLDSVDYARNWANKASSCIVAKPEPLSNIEEIKGERSSCTDTIDTPWYEGDVGADDKWGQGWYDACEVHDVCYATIGKTRRQCDELFYSKLKEACDETTTDLTCRIDAYSYYWVVASFGKQSYNETQTATLAYLRNLKVAYEAGTCKKNAEESNLLYLETEEAKRDVYSWLGFYLHDRNFSKHMLDVKYKNMWGQTWWRNYDGFVYKPNKSLMKLDEAMFNKFKSSENGVFDYVNWFKAQDIWEAGLDQSSYHVYLGDVLTLSGASSHGPNGLDDFNYFGWDFGDGGKTSSQPLNGSITHTYQNRGQYTVTLTANEPSNRFNRNVQAKVTVYNFVDILPAILYLM
jgi:hypothetical protein